MRQLTIISFFLLLTVLGCQRVEVVGVPQVALMTYTLRQDIEFEVKSDVQTTAVNTLSCLVYHFMNGGYEYVPELSLFVDLTDPSNIDNAGNINVSVKLFKDQQYRLIFVAQHLIDTAEGTSNYVYTVNDGVMSVNPNAEITSGEQLEAFAFVDDAVKPTGVESKHITLDRVVSQVNICSSQNTLPSSLNVTVSGMPTSYDLVNDICSNETTTLTFGNIGVPGDKMSVSETEYNRLTTLHFLGSNKIDITLTAEGRETFTINQVDTKVNYKTNIAGNLLPEN